MSLPEIPIHDFRLGGMLGYQREAADRAERILDTLLAALGRSGFLARLLLPLADREAEKRLAEMMDPYHQEIRSVRRAIGRSGVAAMNLTEEMGCTARAFDGQAPSVFRTLDLPFGGLGELVEIVALPGEEGDWMAATWPGLVGCLQGTAPGRFAAALNQAPERVDTDREHGWMAAKYKLLEGPGLVPSHLLRQVFETAPDYAAACKMLSRTPIAAPAIFTVSGTRRGEVCVIERTETNWANAGEPAAANHFSSELALTSLWRSRSENSEARRDQILAENAPPAHNELTAPILNGQTRLAVTANASGEITVTGFDGETRLTVVTMAEIPTPLQVI